MDVLFTSWGLALAEVLWLTKLIKGHSLLVFDGFSHNVGLWESFFVSLIVKGHCCPIEHFLFSVAESMLGWVKFPLIISLPLFSWRKISMRFPIHLSDVSIVVCSTTQGIEDIFGILNALSRHTEDDFTIFSFVWPLIPSLVPFA